MLPVHERLTWPFDLVADRTGLAAGRSVVGGHQDGVGVAEAGDHFRGHGGGVELHAGHIRLAAGAVGRSEQRGRVARAPIQGQTWQHGNVRDSVEGDAARVFAVHIQCQ